MLYALCFLFFAVGLYGVLVRRNLIKIIISLIVMESAVNVFIVMVAYRRNAIAPILDKAIEAQEFVANAADPLPQALVLTAIVIGLGVTAMTVAIAMRLYERYGTYDIEEIKRLKG